MTAKKLVRKLTVWKGPRGKVYYVLRIPAEWVAELGTYTIEEYFSAGAYVVLTLRDGRIIIEPAE